MASWRAAYRGIVSDEFLDGLDPAQRADAWRGFIPDTTVLVAEYGGEVAGFASLAIPARDLDEPAAGEVTTLYVDPERLRRGIGRALMDAAAAELRDAGCDVAVLWVFDENRDGRAFYRALGFTPDGGRRTHGDDAPLEVRLRARLD